MPDTGPTGAAPLGGFGTPSDKIIANIAKAQQAGEKITDPTALGKPPAPLEWIAQAGSFPGHAAWRDGDLKLHRIQDKKESVRWDLYDLAKDPHETHNLAESSQSLPTMQQALEAWLSTVAGSLRGEDYQ